MSVVYSHTLYMNKKVRTFRGVCMICHREQKKGKKIVFCHGFFDILHRGHVTLLMEAKKLGNILVVGVDHDDNARMIKGPKRPINGHDSRIFVLSNLTSVDYVFLIDSFEKINNISDYYTNLYQKLNPDFLATSVRAGKCGKVKRKQAKRAGVEFVDIDHGIYDKGTTRIIEKLGLD